MPKFTIDEIKEERDELPEKYPVSRFYLAIEIKRRENAAPGPGRPRKRNTKQREQWREQKNKPRKEKGK